MHIQTIQGIEMNSKSKIRDTDSKNGQKYGQSIHRNGKVYI